MLGSVRQIVNTGGTVLDTITYDSFGNILTETQPSNGDRFKYAGMQWDSEIGQYYAWHRNYLAGPGRFESEDPIGLAPDENLYRYVYNSPQTGIDPSGLAEKPHWFDPETDKLKDDIPDKVPDAYDCARLQMEIVWATKSIVSRFIGLDPSHPGYKGHLQRIII